MFRVQRFRVLGLRLQGSFDQPLVVFFMVPAAARPPQLFRTETMLFWLLPVVLIAWAHREPQLQHLAVRVDDES